MTYNPDIHHRRSIRLRDYDYAHAGAYFVTICVQNHECLLGDIDNGVMTMNDAGRMVEMVWQGLPDRFPVVKLDTFVVMPNHVHGIIVLPDHRRGESRIRPDGIRPDGIRPYGIRSDFVHPQPETPPTSGDHKDRPYGTTDESIGRIVQAFKSLTTHYYISGVKGSAWPPFFGKFWQRNYYDRIIRNESEFNCIREYIVNNSLKWSKHEHVEPPDET